MRSEIHCRYYFPADEEPYYANSYCNLDDEVDPICSDCEAKNIDGYYVAQLIKEKG